MSAKHTFDSPNGASYTKGVSAWLWLMAWHTTFSRLGFGIRDAWHSRLVPTLGILVEIASNTAWVVISTCSWHIFCVECELARPNEYMIGIAPENFKQMYTLRDTCFRQVVRCVQHKEA